MTENSKASPKKWESILRWILQMLGVTFFLAICLLFFICPCDLTFVVSMTIAGFILSVGLAWQLKGAGAIWRTLLLLIVLATLFLGTFSIALLLDAADIIDIAQDGEAGAGGDWLGNIFLILGGAGSLIMFLFFIADSHQKFRAHDKEIVAALRRRRHVFEKIGAGWLRKNGKNSYGALAPSTCQTSPLIALPILDVDLPQSLIALDSAFEHKITSVPAGYVGGSPDPGKTLNLRAAYGLNLTNMPTFVLCGLTGGGKLSENGTLRFCKGMYFDVYDACEAPIHYLYEAVARDRIATPLAFLALSPNFELRRWLIGKAEWREERDDLLKKRISSALKQIGTKARSPGFLKSYNERHEKWVKRLKNPNGDVPISNLGVSTLLIFKLGDSAQFLLQRRPSDGAIGEAIGQTGVIPSGSYQPTTVAAKHGEWRIRSTIIREFAEEIYGVHAYKKELKEIHARRREDKFKHFEAAFDAWEASGEIKIFYLGLAMNPLSLRLEMLTAMVVSGNVLAKDKCGCADCSQKREDPQKQEELRIRREGDDCVIGKSEDPGPTNPLHIAHWTRSDEGALLNFDLNKAHLEHMLENVYKERLSPSTAGCLYQAHKLFDQLKPEIANTPGGGDDDLAKLADGPLPRRPQLRRSGVLSQRDFDHIIMRWNRLAPGQSLGDDPVVKWAYAGGSPASRRYQIA